MRVLVGPGPNYYQMGLRPGTLKLCLTNKASPLAARAVGVVLAMWESLQNPTQK